MFMLTFVRVLITRFSRGSNTAAGTNRYVCPLEVETKTNVVVICGELPEHIAAILIGGNTHRNHFTPTNCDYGVWIILYLLLKVFDMWSGPHGWG